MSHGAAVWLVLLVAVVAANLPFVNERRFIVGPRSAPKSLGFRVLELVLLYLLTLGLGFAIEARIGQRQPQGWEFYAAFGCFFVTLAFPGFIWRYLRRGRKGR
jgi:Na+(H+)/acetate symporter ActP